MGLDSNQVILLQATLAENLNYPWVAIHGLCVKKTTKCGIDSRSTTLAFSKSLLLLSRSLSHDIILPKGLIVVSMYYSSQ